MENENFQLIFNTKKLWELARQKELSNEKRHNLISQIILNLDIKILDVNLIFI